MISAHTAMPPAIHIEIEDSERREAEGLVDLADLLALLRLRAESRYPASRQRADRTR